MSSIQLQRFWLQCKTFVEANPFLIIIIGFMVIASCMMVKGRDKARLFGAILMTVSVVCFVLLMLGMIV